MRQKDQTALGLVEAKDYRAKLGFFLKITVQNLEKLRFYLLIFYLPTQFSPMMFYPFLLLPLLLLQVLRLGAQNQVSYRLITQDNLPKTWSYSGELLPYSDGVFSWTDKQGAYVLLPTYDDKRLKYSIRDLKTGLELWSFERPLTDSPVQGFFQFGIQAYDLDRDGQAEVFVATYRQNPKAKIAQSMEFLLLTKRQAHWIEAPIAENDLGNKRYAPSFNRELPLGLKGLVQQWLEDLHVQDLEMRYEHQLLTHGPNYWLFESSLQVGSGGKTLRAYSDKTGEALELPDELSRCFGYQIQGNEILFLSSQGLSRFNLMTRQSQNLYQPDSPLPPSSKFSLSPQQKRLAFNTAQNIYVLDLNKDQVEQVQTFPAEIFIEDRKHQTPSPPRFLDEQTLEYLSLNTEIESPPTSQIQTLLLP